MIVQISEVLDLSPTATYKCAQERRNLEESISVIQFFLSSSAPAVTHPTILEKLRSWSHALSEFIKRLLRFLHFATTLIVVKQRFVTDGQTACVPGYEI